MSHRAVLVPGSPTQNSRSTVLLHAFGERLRRDDFEIEVFPIDAFPSEALLAGRFQVDAVTRFANAIKQANAIVFSTPVYKATYSGALKTIVDLIEPTALEGKAALAIATGRLEAHLREVDQAFQRLYAFFRGSRGLPSVTLLDRDLGASAEVALNEVATSAFDEAVLRLTRAVG
jgi:FMN reductase